MQTLAAAPAPHHKRDMEHLTVILRAAPTDCWKCGCDTSILSSITVAVGERQIDCSVADFTDWPELMAELSSRLPASHEIGPIKPRSSATAGRTYMSNGCRHCDAIFGQHFEIHSRYDEMVVASFDLSVSSRWRAFVQSQPD